MIRDSKWSKEGSPRYRQRLGRLTLIALSTFGVPVEPSSAASLGNASQEVLTMTVNSEKWGLAVTVPAHWQVLDAEVLAVSGGQEGTVRLFDPPTNGRTLAQERSDAGGLFEAIRGIRPSGEVIAPEPFDHPQGPAFRWGEGGSRYWVELGGTAWGLQCGGDGCPDIVRSLRAGTAALPVDRGEDSGAGQPAFGDQPLSEALVGTEFGEVAVGRAQTLNVAIPPDCTPAITRTTPPEVAQDLEIGEVRCSGRDCSIPITARPSAARGNFFVFLSCPPYFNLMLRGSAR